MALSNLDAWLLENVNVASLEEISKKTGLSEVEAYSRVREIVREVDVLSVPERIAAILLQLEQMAIKTRQRFDTEKGVALAALIREWREMQKMILGELRVMMSQADENVAAAEARYAVLFSEIAMKGLAATLDVLRADDPEIDVEMVEAVYRQELAAAAAEYSDGF